MIQNAESVPERDHSGRDRATSAIWSLSGAKPTSFKLQVRPRLTFVGCGVCITAWCFASSSPTSRVSYEGAAKEVSALVHKMMRDLQQESARQAKAVASVELGSDEIYHILQTQLLTETPDDKLVYSVAVAGAQA